MRSFVILLIYLPLGSPRAQSHGAEASERVAGYSGCLYWTSLIADTNVKSCRVSKSEIKSNTRNVILVI